MVVQRGEPAGAPRRGRPGPPAVLALAVVAVVLAVSGCGAGTGGSSGAAGSGDVAGVVDIGGGRDVYLECRGSGSPTVVLVSGTGGAADEWTTVLGPSGALEPSGSAVLPRVASFTRVCAYDRPGTTVADGSLSPSTVVPQPTSARAGVADLRAVLSAAGEHGPYVLVGASWGAMIAMLFARGDPGEVAGLVTVDGASVHLRDTLSPDQWSDWMHRIAAMGPATGTEVPDYDSGVAEIRAAPAVPPSLPAAVLTSDEPWDLQVGNSGSTWPAWLAAQDLLAGELHARHLTRTDSGHGIGVEQPRLVSDAVREVVDRARAQG